MLWGVLFGRCIERKIQRQDIDAWFAKQPELTALSVLDHQIADARLRNIPRLGDPRHLEERGVRRDVGASPLPEVVTRSTGTGLEGFSSFSFSTSSLTRSFNALLVGPRLEPPELDAL